jgi:subtilase family serine protease
VPIDENQRITLKGNTHPFARSASDLGAASADLPMERMLLVLKRSSVKESALRQFLDNQQNRSSVTFHQWLSPEQFGSDFGPSDAELQTVTLWLRSHGLKIVGPTKGRTVIEFSGSAGQVKEVFYTEIHRYLVNNELHWANSSDPQIPLALAPVVAGIASLHDFTPKPLHRVATNFEPRIPEQNSLLAPKPTPAPCFVTGYLCPPFSIPCSAISPYDFATIYKVLPLWNESPSIDGTGEAIAIVGQSDIYPQDFTNFRAYFKVPPGTLNIIYNGAPPDKVASQGDELESNLDVEWSGAIAKGATIDLVASTTT